MSKRPPELTLQDLAPHAENPRKISPEQSLNLARSLDEFGDIGGIVYNLTTKRLIAGHQRVALFKNDPDAKIVISDKTHRTWYVETHSERFPIRLVEWDEIKEKQAMIAANKQGGDWDTKALQRLLREIPDPALMGFTEEEMERLFPPPPPTLAEEPEEDENQGIRHCCPSCGHQWVGKPA